MKLTAIGISRKGGKFEIKTIKDELQSLSEKRLRACRRVLQGLREARDGDRNSLSVSEK